jgi:hypothetical protein
LYVETRWKSYQCNTCSNDKSTIFNKSVSIIMNFNSMEIYINTFKKYKTNDSFKIIYIFLGKFLCIEKLFILENCLDKKKTWIEKLLTLKKRKIKNLFAFKILPTLEKYFNWKTTYIENLLAMIKKYFKNNLH